VLLVTQFSISISTNQEIKKAKINKFGFYVNPSLDVYYKTDIRCTCCCMNCNILVMEQVEDTQHTQQNKENTLFKSLLQEVVPMWTEKDFPVR